MIVAGQAICWLANVLRYAVEMIGIAMAFADAASAQNPFYQASDDDLKGAPGTLIRFEPIPLPPPAGAQTVYRILYRSTGLKDEPIAVSGVVLIPATPAPAGAGAPYRRRAYPTSGGSRRAARRRLQQARPELRD